MLTYLEPIFSYVFFITITFLSYKGFPCSILKDTYFIGCVFSRFSPVWLFVILWIVAQQAPLSMGFSRQEYWCG